MHSPTEKRKFADTIDFTDQSQCDHSLGLDTQYTSHPQGRPAEYLQHLLFALLWNSAAGSSRETTEQDDIYCGSEALPVLLHVIAPRMLLTQTRNILLSLSQM
jgi:hypothetical protein